MHFACSSTQKDAENDTRLMPASISRQLALGGKVLSMAFDFDSLDHPFFMREALNEAAAAMRAGERPIGAVIVHDGRIVGRGRAEHEGRHNRLAHAELNALLATATSLYDHPHENGVIYTTLEPCEMCLGAIVMSDVVNHVVFAMADRWINPSPMLEMPHVRRHIKNYVGGVLADESMALWQQCRPDEFVLIRDGHKP
jgi:tRNA(adenine34) deaminase